jgi:hypothetical protein
VRLQASVTAEPPGLAMSDLVLLCRAPVTGGGSSPLLIEPDFDARLAARTASVYFEVQGLTVDAQGRAHFSYRYTLRAVNAAPSGRPRLAAFEASREEENIGPFRRQVVSAPIDRLAAGTYEFEVEVRDLQSGAVAARSVSFTKD